MTLPILDEPIPSGFRATTGSPLDLAAERPTAMEAVATLRQLVNAKLATGAYVISLPVPMQHSSSGPDLTNLAENPLWDSFLDAMKQNREEMEREDAAREAAEDALLSPAQAV